MNCIYIGNLTFRLKTFAIRYIFIFIKPNNKQQKIHALKLFQCLYMVITYNKSKLHEGKSFFHQKLHTIWVESL
jgi:hypothetical protein